jgi:hypothetical protein
MTNNITEKHQRDFNALVSGKYDSFALFSCFINGEPGAVIVTVVEQPNGKWLIQPLFVAVTEAMVITDHDGVEARELTVDHTGKVKADA